MVENTGIVVPASDKYIRETLRAISVSGSGIARKHSPAGEGITTNRSIDELYV